MTPELAQDLLLIIGSMVAGYILGFLWNATSQYLSGIKWGRKNPPPFCPKCKGILP